MTMIVALPLLAAVALAAPNKPITHHAAVTDRATTPHIKWQTLSLPTHHDHPITIAVVPTKTAHDKRGGPTTETPNYPWLSDGVWLQTREKTVVYPGTTLFNTRTEVNPTAGTQIFTESQVWPGTTLVEIRNHTSLHPPITVEPGLPWPFGESPVATEGPHVDPMEAFIRDTLDPHWTSLDLPPATKPIYKATRIQVRDWPTASQEEEDALFDPFLDMLGIPQLEPVGHRPEDFHWKNEFEDN